MTRPHLLDTSLDTAAATPLRQEMLARLALGQPILLDGSQVKRVGQACLQLLVAARTAARAEGVAFDMIASSAILNEMVTLAGLNAVLEPIEGAVRAAPAAA
jgi:chemotaxis protein CheX